jgi:hypothetical protein
MVQYDNGAYLDTLWKSLVELEEETKRADHQEALQRFDRIVAELQQLGTTPQELRTRVTALTKSKWCQKTTGT